MWDFIVGLVQRVDDSEWDGKRSDEQFIKEVHIDLVNLVVNFYRNQEKDVGYVKSRL